MMPGIGFAEMLLLALVAVVVIGPKDLPLMARKFGRFTGKMRAMAFEFKQGIDELGRQAELEELRKEVSDLKKSTGFDEMERDFNEDARKVEADVNKAMTLPSHPAASSNGAAANGAAAPPPTPAYAGLSADHPGYDTGDDHRIDGGAPQLASADNVHIVPDDSEAAATPEQAQSELGKSDQGKADVAKPEPAKPEPTKSAPAKQDASA